MSERMKQAVETVRNAQAFKWPFSELLDAIEALNEEVDALRARVASLEPVQPPSSEPTAHEAAVAKLDKQGFRWGQREGDTYTIPSGRHLTRMGSLGRGWIEISGERGLVGPVVMRVDGGFPLRFPSLVDLVAHLEETPP